MVYRHCIVPETNPSNGEMSLIANHTMAGILLFSLYMAGMTACHFLYDKARNVIQFQSRSRFTGRREAYRIARCFLRKVRFQNYLKIHISIKGKQHPHHSPVFGCFHHKSQASKQSFITTAGHTQWYIEDKKAFAPSRRLSCPAITRTNPSKV